MFGVECHPVPVGETHVFPFFFRRVFGRPGVGGIAAGSGAAPLVAEAARDEVCMSGPRGHPQSASQVYVLQCYFRLVSGALKYGDNDMRSLKSAVGFWGTRSFLQ